MCVTICKSKWLCFIEEIGLKKHVGEILWEGDICLPQELAALETDELKAICICSELIMKHAVLCRKALTIAISEDSFDKAKRIIKEDSQQFEHTENDSRSTSTEDTRHDSGCFNANNSSKNLDSQENNNESSCNISGGNFTQSCVGSPGPVIFNNRNTIVTSTPCKRPKTEASSNDGEEEDELSMICPGNDDARKLRDSSEDQTSSTGMVFNNPTKQDEVYTLRNDASRRALIINVGKFKDGVQVEDRVGSDVDCKDMKTIFEQLKFVVEVHHDKTAAEIEELVRSFTWSAENENTDMTAVYIGSHGQRDETGNDSFMGSDGEMVSFTDIREKFYPDNSRHLKGKPKLFFLQFCRTDPEPVPDAAEIREVDLQSDAGREGESSSTEEDRKLDIICAFATKEGCSAYRNTQEGSWFVLYLKKIFSEDSGNDDLQTMLTKVNKNISFRCSVDGRTNKPASQISEVVSSLRKKVFFHLRQC